MPAKGDPPGHKVKPPTNPPPPRPLLSRPHPRKASANAHPTVSFPSLPHRAPLHATPSAFDPAPPPFRRSTCAGRRRRPPAHHVVVFPSCTALPANRSLASATALSPPTGAPRRPTRPVRRPHPDLATGVDGLSVPRRRRRCHNGRESECEHCRNHGCGRGCRHRGERRCGRCRRGRGRRYRHVHPGGCRQ